MKYNLYIYFMIFIMHKTFVKLGFVFLFVIWAFFQSIQLKTHRSENMLPWDLLLGHCRKDIH